MTEPPPVGAKVRLVGGIQSAGDETGWDGLECQVLAWPEWHRMPRDGVVFVRPLTPRPDDLGMQEFSWFICEMEYPPPTPDEVNEAITSIKSSMKQNN